MAAHCILIRICQAFSRRGLRNSHHDQTKAVADQRQRRLLLKYNDKIWVECAVSKFQNLIISILRELTTPRRRLLEVLGPYRACQSTRCLVGRSGLCGFNGRWSTNNLALIRPCEALSNGSPRGRRHPETLAFPENLAGRVVLRVSGEQVSASLRECRNTHGLVLHTPIVFELNGVRPAPYSAGVLRETKLAS